MVTTIATSTSSTATAYSNQRKIDRCQNGVLWAIVGIYDSTNATTKTYAANLYYSTDDGATWTLDSGNRFLTGTGFTQNNGASNFSLFIDLDDYAHVVWKDPQNSWVYYRRGTPNAARTAWTWSAAVSVGSSTADTPDIVVHREGTGWVAHVVYGYTNDLEKIAYKPITISSGGTITAAGSETRLDSGTINSTMTGWGSIDFNHTGDGKTVAGGTPHLYVAWSNNAAGAGNGIRFRKATYSAGTWTWGTEREIDNTVYIDNNTRWLLCMFDGTRVVITGWLHTSSSVGGYIWDRDAADTTTTAQVTGVGTLIGQPGSATYDSQGNVWWVGTLTGPPGNGYVRVWNRATNTTTAAS